MWLGKDDDDGTDAGDSQNVEDVGVDDSTDDAEMAPGHVGGRIGCW